MERDTEFDTTVLTDDYSDFQDTVVDQVIAFDPSLFQAKPASSSGRDPDEDTWVLNPNEAPRRMGGAAAASVPVQQPSQRASTRSFGSQANAGRLSKEFASASQQRALRTTSAMMAATDAKPDKVSTALIGVVVALAIVGFVAVVVVIIMLIAPQGGGGQPSASAPAVVALSSESSSAASDSVMQSEPEKEPEVEVSRSAESSYKQGTGSSAIVAGGSERTLSESDFYNLLSSYYDQAGDYDASVRTAASDFNENYLKDDKAARNAKASAAASLKVKIKSSWDDLKNLESPFMSKNTQAFRDLCELYECLWRRIDVIDQAWKIDLTFDKPKGHESEIIEPIRAQQSGGNDKYYTRFKDLYPKVSLVKP